MKKNSFFLIIIIFYLCNASYLFASFDNVQKKIDFLDTSLEQFVQSLEDKFQVKIDVYGINNNQNLVMSGGDYTLHDSFVHFFKINNIKNSSFILNEKEKIVKVWILSDNEVTKSNSVAGSIVGKRNGQVGDGNPEIGSELDSSSNPRTEFTDKEIEQLESDSSGDVYSAINPRTEFTEEEIRQMEEERIVYENSPNNPRTEFTEEEIRQMEEEHIVYENSPNNPRAEFTEEEIRQMEEDRILSEN